MQYLFPQCMYLKKHQNSRIAHYHTLISLGRKVNEKQHKIGVFDNTPNAGNGKQNTHLKYIAPNDRPKYNPQLMKSIMRYQEKKKKKERTETETEKRRPVYSNTRSHKITTGRNGAADTRQNNGRPDRSTCHDHFHCPQHQIPPALYVHRAMRSEYERMIKINSAAHQS